MGVLCAEVERSALPWHNSWGAAWKCQVNTSALPFELALWPGQGSPQACKGGHHTCCNSISLSVATQIREGRTDTKTVERYDGTLLCPVFPRRAADARLPSASWIWWGFMRTQLCVSQHHLGWKGPQDISGPTSCSNQAQYWIQTILSSCSITNRAARKWDRYPAVRIQFNFPWEHLSSSSCLPSSCIFYQGDGLAPAVCSVW